MPSDSDNPNVRELQVEFQHIDERLDDLKQTVKDGFEGVHHRQDVTNGKVLENEKDIEQLKEKIKKSREDLNNLDESLSQYKINQAQKKATNWSQTIQKHKFKIVAFISTIVSGILVWLITTKVF